MTHVGLTIECFIPSMVFIMFSFLSLVIILPFILSWFIIFPSIFLSFIIFFSKFKTLLTLRSSASISKSSPDIIATEYWNNPSGDNLEPWGIEPVVILVISVIVSGSTTETFDGFILPCKLKFTQYKKPVIAEISIEAGNNPNVVLATAWLVSVEYLTKVPNGFPWAKDIYQKSPLGSTVIPWGPSISANINPTSILSASTASFPSNFMRETVSSDSEAT